METSTAHEAIEKLKMRCLKEKMARSKDDMDKGRVVDGPAFFDSLLAGKHE